MFMTNTGNVYEKQRERNPFRIPSLRTIVKDARFSLSNLGRTALDSLATPHSKIIMEKVTCLSFFIDTRTGKLHVHVSA